MRLVLLCCLVAAALAAPPSYNPESAQILKYENDNIGTGGYRFAFEQSDGTKHEAQGNLINEGKEDEAVVVKGVYSYVIDGVTYTVTYVADQNGYQPTIEQGKGGTVGTSGTGGTLQARVVTSLLGG